MEISTTSRNLNISDDLRDYADKRLSKLSRLLRTDASISLKLRRENAKSTDDRFIAEATIKLKGAILRAEERSRSPEAAIDIIEERLARQLRRIKTRYERRRKTSSILDTELTKEITDAANLPENELIELSYGRVARTKRHTIYQMSIEDAAEQMDLLGHTFYLFREKDGGDLQVVYQRHDGDYGLIIPE